MMKLFWTTLLAAGVMSLSSGVAPASDLAIKGEDNPLAGQPGYVRGGAAETQDQYGQEIEGGPGLKGPQTELLLETTEEAAEDAQGILATD